jgi:hypothetical protein
MASFALINENNIVIGVLAVSNDDITENGVEIEQKGVDFLFNTIDVKSAYPSTKIIKQTSYNAKIRHKYASIGDTWDELKNAFITPKPFTDWVLNGVNWEAPKAYPTDGKRYVWENNDWVEFNLK